MEIRLKKKTNKSTTWNNQQFLILESKNSSTLYQRTHPRHCIEWETSSLLHTQKKKTFLKMSV